jgi:hypothetical protein
MSADSNNNEPGGQAAPTQQDLPPDQIRAEEDVQARSAIGREVIEEYAERIKAGDSFPPLDVFFDDEDYWLADGFHRWHAYEQATIALIPCRVHQGTRADAQWFAIQANRTHGLPRTNADKVRAVETALRHPNGAAMSDGQIAAHVGVSDRMVAKYRQELTPNGSESAVRTGRDGRTINTAQIGKVKCNRSCTAELGVATDATAPPRGELAQSPGAVQLAVCEGRVNAGPAAPRSVRGDDFDRSAVGLLLHQHNDGKSHPAPTYDSVAPEHAMEAYVHETTVAEEWDCRRQRSQDGDGMDYAVATGKEIVVTTFWNLVWLRLIEEVGRNRYVSSESGRKFSSLGKAVAEELLVAPRIVEPTLDPSPVSSTGTTTQSTAGATAAPTPYVA